MAGFKKYIRRQYFSLLNKLWHWATDDDTPFELEAENKRLKYRLKCMKDEINALQNGFEN
ncbi:hypothetical protein LJB89_00275 [Tyzzerella sp. OttesenSCG-928-J15]|nr:hypothetical protein [Tyzzerella sp. OttesenSCG-928-J15]